jgi:DNA-3-methyladenine glycosylase II
LLEAGEPALRSVGLSGVKARYVLNLAEAVGSGRVPVEKAHHWTDDEVVDRLTSIKGVGVWTAEMFLMFSLARPDVFPVGDLGIRAALRDRLGLPDLPKPAACRELAEPWRPYRSVASWYLWRSLDPAYKVAPNAANPPTKDQETPPKTTQKDTTGKRKKTR